MANYKIWIKKKLHLLQGTVPRFLWTECNKPIRVGSLLAEVPWWNHQKINQGFHIHIMQFWLIRLCSLVLLFQRGTHFASTLSIRTHKTITWTSLLWKPEIVHGICHNQYNMIFCHMRWQGTCNWIIRAKFWYWLHWYDLLNIQQCSVKYTPD